MQIYVQNVKYECILKLGQNRESRHEVVEALTQTYNATHWNSKRVFDF